MKIEIIKKSKLWLGISGVLVALSVLFLFVPGLNKGIDFTGGTLFQVDLKTEVNQAEISKVIEELSSKYEELKSNRVQISEKTVAIIRTSDMKEATQVAFVTDLKKNYADLNLMKIDKVSPTVGKELLGKAIRAIFWGAVLILIYISLRFEFKFAVAAVVALLHDIIIAAGVIALLKYEINTPFIAAMLTILGYSINDTIVVFDRIRENMKKDHTMHIDEVMDKSISQVLVRSINTSLTTLVAVGAMWALGGASLKTFMTTLLIGVITGTYSSIFVASATVNILEKKFPRKEVEEQVEIVEEDMDAGVV